MTDFENAMKKVTEVIHAAARKSGEILENTKISYNISTEREKINKLQSKIGAKFYKIYKEGGVVPEAIIADLEAISAVEDVIRELEKTIRDTKPYKYCSECGAKLELNDVYCAKCGAKQHDPKPEAESCCCGCEDEKTDDCCEEKDECCEEKDGDCGCDE